MGTGGVRGDAPRMLNGFTHHKPALLAAAVTGMLAWAGNAPAPAASCAPGAADKPDLGFVDSNCDGIDGDKANAIFVAPNGDDNNDGSFGKPMATVKAAVTAATAANKDVYAAAGVYDGKPGFLGTTGHIGLYGGYDPQTWQRSATNVTTLQAPGQVVGVAVPGIVLQLLTVHGLPGSTTSYGVRAFYNGSVALSRVTVQPAAGADGANGTDASQTPPATAPKGNQGVGNPNCDPNALKGIFNAGATGGSAPGLLSGGTGGDWHKPYPFSGTDGDSDFDLNVLGGKGGELAWPGGPGSPGKVGAAGLPGYADLNAANTLYVPMNGTDAGNGTRGAGGGGGGMGQNTCIPGSGGGAGGRPGEGGKGGKAGGGSIGVFAGAGAHVLVVDSSIIHAADGGKGGNGGLGQPGGEGGDGGDPGVDFYENGQWPGTAGGHGGKGGAGGRGGGAAGGASIGVLAIDARETVTANATITVGKGGMFGVGGHNGWQGLAQNTAQVTTANGSIPPVGDFDGDGITDDADSCPIAAGTNNGCPVDAPTGPVAGDPTATPPASTGTASGAGAGEVTVAVLPASSCVSKRVFKIRINARKAHIKTARLTLDGRRLKLVKGKTRWTAKVDLRHSKRTRHTLTIRGTLRSGKRFKQTRHYRTC
jgi:hypothetical protein